MQKRWLRTVNVLFHETVVYNGTCNCNNLDGKHVKEKPCGKGDEASLKHFFFFHFSFVGSVLPDLYSTQSSEKTAISSRTEE